MLLVDYCHLGADLKRSACQSHAVPLPCEQHLCSCLLCTGDACFRGFGRRKGERRRKAVRGCIVSSDLSVLNLVIVRKGALENVALASSLR